MNEAQLIKDILKQEKSDQLEFTRAIHLDTIGKIVCGFLNNNGGQLIIGVGKDKALIGINDAQDNAAVVEKFLLDEIIPEAPIMVSVEPVNDKELIFVQVWTGSKKPYIFSGAIFFRRELSTVQASSKELSQLIHERGKTEIQWERQPVNDVEFSDFDLDEIEETMKAAFTSHKNQELKNAPLDFLSYYGLYQNGQFTNAAVLLFAKQPFRFLPQSRVRLAILSEGKTNDNFNYDKLLEGNLFKNFNAIEDFYKINVDFNKNLSAWRRTEFEYPELALREGAINALVHSDYSFRSGSISIIRYPDKLEIINIGKLPIPVSELKKNHLSMPINPDIAHIVFLRGYMEKIGRGTNKIIEACKNADLKEPSWKNSSNTVCLSFYSQKNKGANKGAFEGLIDGAVNKQRLRDLTKTLANILLPGLGGLLGTAVNLYTDKVKENLVILITAIYQNEGARVPEYTDLTGFSTSTIERYIKILRDGELIDFKGDAAQTGGYYLTDKTKKVINSENE